MDKGMEALALDLAAIINVSNSSEDIIAAGAHIVRLLNKGALDTAELRKSAEFNEALGKMKRQRGKIRELADVIDRKVGVMDSKEATLRDVRSLIRAHLLRAGPEDRLMRRTIRSQLRRVLPVDASKPTKPRKLPTSR